MLADVKIGGKPGAPRRHSDTVWVPFGEQLPEEPIRIGFPS